jgi:hypothetical protein
VSGLGLATTITALVRFQQEIELQKVLQLESEIKKTAEVNVRNFLGHITLAYCVKSLRPGIETIQKVLRFYQGHVFGEFRFSEFDLTYFTDMNTYLPLMTVNFANGRVQNQAINLDNITITEAVCP